MLRTVLISGGGIAGLTLAAWLRRHGFEVTVVERAPRARTTGQAIDVRGPALAVLDRMGLGDELRRRRTRLRGMSWLDGSGEEQWRSEEFVLSSGRLDSDDVEIMRNDLTSIVQGDTEVVFGDWITGIVDGSDGVRVEFAHAGARRFDLVVGADGLYSGVRRLAFGPHERYLRHLGAHLGVFGGPNLFGLEDWQVWVQDPAATYVVYPTSDNAEVRVTVGFESQSANDHRDETLHRRLMAERIERVPWQRDTMLKTLEAADDLQFGAMAQVRLDGWSRGRVALVGDAASSPSPLTGQGTSLALVQAYVLAEELGNHRDVDDGHQAAYRRYERRLREFVELNQALVHEEERRPADEDELAHAKNAFDLDA